MPLSAPARSAWAILASSRSVQTCTCRPDNRKCRAKIAIAARGVVDGSSRLIRMMSCRCHGFSMLLQECPGTCLSRFHQPIDIGRAPVDFAFKIKRNLQLIRHFHTGNVIGLVVIGGKGFWNADGRLDIEFWLGIQVGMRGPGSCRSASQDDAVDGTARCFLPADYGGP